MAVEAAVAKPTAPESVTIVDADAAKVDVDSDLQSVQDSNSDNIDDSSNVMLASCQDPLLVPTYKKLPKILHLCEVMAFTSCIESLQTPFGATCENMSKEEINAFLRALLFVKSGQYDKKALAICIMSGTLTESFVVESCEAGPRHAPYPIHKVTIAPLEQDWHRDVSVWGLLFGFHFISGMLSESRFGFVTRGEGKGNGWKNASAPSSPVKNRPSSSVLKAVSSSSVPRTADSIYAASCSFDDRIPMYDGCARNGRAPFMFMDADFGNLLSWPLY
ncbi:hypothetical protein BYT27DRAFT_7260510 [Phlegmacium glaucopus]|nr:hypothetical protein BYT27DRAFT_7260510 [Phlegmacium glaucopus]